ncbi:divergent polysaccharide deacetylase family protein [Terrarubrum flagellatum]|uniref:divergent polysaccharide deacetylase family protein n=1 Tax=Terrirubrum flagellatum TaxID=2895980 RepID=UPI00314554B8
MTDLASDDLSRPLGHPERAARPRFAVSARTIAGVLSGVMVATFAGQIWLGRSAAPGMNVAEIRRTSDKPAPSAPAATVKVDPSIDSPADKPRMNAQEMENSSGVTVVRGGGVGAPESVIIQVAPPAKLSIAAPDKKLLDRSRHGALPKIAADGTRPSQYYARPVAADSVAGKPRIAILVGGLGVSQTATSDAIAKLPGAVSLAFAPYGGELDRQTQRARAEGHELFMQAPMEPFDYPDNDPGPHTLRTGVADAENLDKLQWVMSRIQGYVGVVNYMGAKFSADGAPLAPMLKEMANRGLMIVDDGSSNRSQIVSVAQGLKAPAARADSVIDAVLRADAIDKELAKLETMARDKGVAIGAASALPMTIDRIARWARALDAKGIVLVPVSYAVTTGKKDGGR